MRRSFLVGGALFGFSIISACGSTTTSSGFNGADGNGGSGSGGGSLGTDGGGSVLGGDGGGVVTMMGGDPTTCAEAASSNSYVGCDYWPTVLANNVWSIFDFAVVVANTGSTEADITVTGPNGFTQTANVPANQLTKIYLPWVSELKGPDTDSCGDAMPLTASVLSHGGGYHLVSSVPVTVYQFNALEYKGEGGPSGKNWDSCPGTTMTCDEDDMPIGCLSYSNDASLLLPSTAMTGNYRVMGEHGWSEQADDGSGSQDIMGAYFAVTATQDNTDVTVQISSTGRVLAGTGIAATEANGILKFSLNAGDVAEVVGDLGDQVDLSGSLINATKPVQLLTGIPCIYQPEGSPSCDHIESSVFPAETLGKHYVVSPPTAPNGNVVGHVVRFYGNVDGTHLTFTPSMPSGCKATLDAGEVVDCGVVQGSFDVSGDHEFGVGTFMLGGSLLDPDSAEGDPSESMVIAVEQYRTRYVFLAPDDYDISYVDIVTPSGNSITLDGNPVSQAPTTITSSYGVIRKKITGGGAGGSHVLTATSPVSIQVIGYGTATSYQFPGGLNLNSIATAPVIVPK
jgi:hypothetical protein